jgi:hypothetical protein
MPETPHPALITTREACSLLRFASPDGAIRHLRGAGLVPIRRGSTWLWNHVAVLGLLNEASSTAEPHHPTTGSTTP